MSIGIKSLNDRLTALEEGKVVKNDNFADKLVDVTSNFIKSDLNTVLKHYEDGLSKLGIDVTKMTFNDLIKVVPYTIMYVERNIKYVADIIKKDVNSMFKLSTAISFITQYIKCTIEQEKFLSDYINQIVDLLLNSAKSTMDKVIVNTSKTKVKTMSMSKKTGKKFSLFN